MEKLGYGDQNEGAERLLKFAVEQKWLYLIQTFSRRIAENGHRGQVMEKLET